MEIEFLCKTRNLIVVKKNAGVPSQPDPSGDADALSLSKDMLQELGEDDTLYPVNRLDRVVGGLLIFARNKQYAGILSEGAASGKIVKEYLAVVSGAPSGGELVNYLYKDARISKSFVVKGARVGAKRAVLDYTPLATVTTDNGTLTLIRVRLHTGRYHQIRCQMSYLGNPIVGDGKYGSRDKGAKFPALFSYRLSFTVPEGDVSVSAMPDADTYPWNLFSINELAEDVK